MEIFGVALAAWLGAALVLAPAIGRAVRLADDREPAFHTEGMLGSRGRSVEPVER